MKPAVACANGGPEGTLVQRIRSGLKPSPPSRCSRTPGSHESKRVRPTHDDGQLFTSDHHVLNIGCVRHRTLIHIKIRRVFTRASDAANPAEGTRPLHCYRPCYCKRLRACPLRETPGCACDSDNHIVLRRESPIPCPDVLQCAGLRVSPVELVRQCDPAFSSLGRSPGFDLNHDGTA
jgi:hypothetical protein